MQSYADKHIVGHTGEPPDTSDARMRMLISVMCDFVIRKFVIRENEIL